MTPPGPAQGGEGDVLQIFLSALVRYAFCHASAN